MVFELKQVAAFSEGFKDFSEQFVNIKVQMCHNLSENLSPINPYDMGDLVLAMY